MIRKPKKNSSFDLITEKNNYPNPNSNTHIKTKRKYNQAITLTLFVQI